MGTPMMLTPGKRGSRESLQDSFEEELVILLSKDSQDQIFESKVTNLLGQWDLVVSMVSKLGSGLRSLKSTVNEELTDLEFKLLGVDARMGSTLENAGFEDCASAWDGLMLLQSNLQEMAKNNETVKDTVTTALDSIDGKISRAITDHQRVANGRIDRN
jgi:hypothetical protein